MFKPLALLLAAALLAAPMARAGTPFAAKPMDDEALSEVRGGYLTANGLSFDFGAQISTFIDNKLVMQSRLTLNDQGLSTEQTGLAAGNAMGGFVSIPGQGGDTRVLQLIDPARIGSVVLNTASNRDIRQDTALTLVVPGLANLQNQVNLQRLSSQLNPAGLVGTMSRFGR